MFDTFTLEGDITLFYTDSPLIPASGTSDIKLSNGDVVRDPTFKTAVLISLFSDARAATVDELYDTLKTQGGYFGSAVAGFTIGSKLWLLGRSKLDATTFRLAESYAKEALRWMIDDEIADSIEAIAYSNKHNQLDMEVLIIRPQAKNVYAKYYVNWEYQKIGGLAT